MGGAAPEEASATEEQTTRRLRRIDRTRRWQLVGTSLALLYAVAVLVVASVSADLGLFHLQGSALLKVDAGSAAEEAGLAAGDLLIAINGEPTADPVARSRALRSIEPGEEVSLLVRRGGEVFATTFTAERTLPLGSAAASALATLLLVIALLADRGRGAGGYPRAFFHSTLVYVVFLAGTFSLSSSLDNPALALPWVYAMLLAAPVTCHFMMKFPAGPQSLSAGKVAWIYAPPVALATVLAANQLLFLLGVPFEGHIGLCLYGGVGAGLMAALYLALGGLSRTRRIRRKRNEVDPVAAKWLTIGAFAVAAPLCAGVVWAAVDAAAFVAGGFAPLVAVATVGGSITVVLAMTRVRFGQLDTMWRRSSGYVLATGMAAGLYLIFIGLLGGTASAMSGGDFRAALAATLAAAVVFGPLRLRVQRIVDERFGRERSRARRLLREAAEAAAATLDIASLQSGVVHRVRAALGAEGASIYVADAAAKGGWRCASLAGSLAISDALDPEAPEAMQLDAAITARAPRSLPCAILAIPLPVSDREPAALVVQPRGGRRFDEEERDLLSTVGAGLVVALANARAHSELRQLNERLQREVEIAEEQRQEIGRLKERLEEENRVLIGQLAARTGRAPVIGQGLKGTFELVQKVARTDTSTLVSGETGVGKELVARAIHSASPRRDGPFIVVDCGAISAGLVESTLFGHVRGAFTGAIRDARGAFRSAHGGTIFLDEIGELPAELQPKLLRALQEREVRPVGAESPQPVDVRVIAGTNRDLSAEVEAGNFRQDLLYRLQVVEIQVPPLRERRGDIEAMAEHFLSQSAERTGRPKKRLAPDAVAALAEHDWPGNVRELEHTLEAAAVYAEGEEIRASDLPIYDQLFKKRGRRAISENGTSPSGGAPRGGLRQTLEDLEKERLLEALRENGGNKTRTAKSLGMSRGALLRRLKRYQVAAA